MTLQFKPFPFGVDASRSTWDSMIQEYGGLILLRQHGIPDRWASAIVGQFTAMERLGQASNPTDRKALVSAISPDTGAELDPIPSERDTLCRLYLNPDGSPVLDVAGNPRVRELLKIVAPPVPVGTSDPELYWKVTVRGTVEKS